MGMKSVLFGDWIGDVDAVTVSNATKSATVL